jgi:sortase A
VNRQRALRLSSWLCLAIGAVCAGWFLYGEGDARLFERSQRQALEEIIAGDAPETIVPTSADPAPPARATRPARPDPNLIGRIEIPRLKVSAIVLEGATERTLRRAVGHVTGTALPGETGNVALAAHREKHFRPLRLIREGDAIRLVSRDGVYHYRVDSAYVVGPHETSVLADTPEPTVTLITCYPFDFVGRAPQRFVVRARLVAEP